MLRMVEMTLSSKYILQRYQVVLYQMILKQNVPKDWTDPKGCLRMRIVLIFQAQALKTITIEERVRFL